jgi:hypothetical protein
VVLWFCVETEYGLGGTGLSGDEREGERTNGVEQGVDEGPVECYVRAQSTPLLVLHGQNNRHIPSLLPQRLTHQLRCTLLTNRINSFRQLPIGRSANVLSARGGVVRVDVGGAEGFDERVVGWGGGGVDGVPAEGGELDDELADGGGAA